MVLEARIDVGRPACAEAARKVVRRSSVCLRIGFAEPITAPRQE